MASSIRGSYATDNGIFTAFPSRRSVVHSTKGIVSTISPLANEAGLKILRQGGNAADAAVAAAAVLNLVDPSMTGIGGDAFALFYRSKDKKVHALNGSGRSAASATLEDVCHDLSITDRIYGTIPTSSALSVTVPGAAAAWVDIVQHFGSGAVSLADVFAPAIELAENGCPISEIASYFWVATEEELRRKPNGIELLKEDPSAPCGYRAPRPGELYNNPLLATTFRRLAESGKAGFYEGPVAESIVRVVKDLGGYLTVEDLQRHGSQGSEVVEPVSIRLEHASSVSGDVDLWEHPPNGQGIVAQMALGILQILEKQGKIPKFGPSDHNSAEYIHALVEALRIAFADGTWFITDPHATNFRTTSLLSEEYLAERAKLFDAKHAAKILDRGSPAFKISDTIYLAVTDQDGNACSFVNSVADTFGSRIVPPGVGFVLQSRGAGFHLHPADHPNIYAPNKRPYNTIIPAMLTNSHDGSLNTVLGVMGGAMQPQGHAQVLLNMLKFNMNPQAALDAPRICIGVSLPGKSTDPTKKVDNTVYLEEGIGESVAKALEEMGHEVKMVTGMGRALFGRGQVINVHHDPVGGERIYSAGSDMRGDGAAAPLI
ncbi:gamma-glutamyltranspeptidase [Podospora aff. communis PSN243]|uniref:Gamma-glutamyltranspeptidase n=1 Tax=Podospora aff. communis PSN243 TaxID=3040156 RepID=A0AAV9GUJ8_9PEZI|nr:gamma-glutamyltranspeptidase [Podospora aff. communis PSN243]